MVLYTKDSIQEVKTQARIVEVVKDIVKLTQRGSQWVGLCPFHSEKSPSFYVNPGSQFYHCFGCGVSGDSLSFIMQTQGMSFPEAIEYLAGRFGITLQKLQTRNSHEGSTVDKKRLYEINNIAAKLYRQNLIIEISKPGILKDYLIERGLSTELCERFNLGFALNSWRSLSDELKKNNFKEDDLLQVGLAKRNSKGELYDIFRARLLFPIAQDDRRVLAFGGRIVPNLLPESETSQSPKYLNSPESPLYHKQNVLYGIPQAMESIRKERFVYLVEGYMDVIGLARANINNSVAACGTAFTKYHAERLSHLCKKVVIIFDADNAGYQAAGRAFEVFLNTGLDLRVLFLPEGDDPESFTRKYPDSAREELAKLSAHSPLSCFIKSEISKLGLQGIADLTPVMKGQIADAVAALLKQVKNKVERQELESQAAILLGIKQGALSDQIRAIVFEKPILEKQIEVIREVSFRELPNIDQELVMLCMVHRQQLLDLIVNDPVFCQSLQATTICFLRELLELFHASADEDAGGDIKKFVHSLLNEYGPSWVAAWRKAFEMHSGSKQQYNDVFQKYKIAYERQGMLKLLDYARNQLIDSQDDSEQQEITNKIIGLSRKLAEMR